MASNKRILLLVILFPFFAFANENKYIIYFKDKPFDSQLKNKFTHKAIAFRTKMNRNNKQKQKWKWKKKGHQDNNKNKKARCKNRANNYYPKSSKKRQKRNKN